MKKVALKNIVFCSIIAMLLSCTSAALGAPSGRVFRPLVVTQENHAADGYFVKNLPDYLKLIKHSYFLTSGRSYRVELDDKNNALLNNSILFEDDRPAGDVNAGFCPPTFHCKKPVEGVRGANWGSGPANKVRGFVKKHIIGINTEVESDFPGFVAYKWANDSHDRNKIVIVIRGTQAGADGFTGADWNANYAGEPTEAIFGKMKVRLHRGYYEKYLLLKESLYSHILVTIMRGVENHAELNPSLSVKDAMDQFLENTQFLVTGHSQGGGLAQIALLDLVTDMAKTLYGISHDNNTTNRFQGYGASPPRVMADRKSADFFYAQVGDNFIRHSSPFDVVSVVGIGENIKNSFFGWLFNAGLNFVAGTGGGFVEVGHLALTPAVTLFNRSFEINRKNGAELYQDKQANDDRIAATSKYLRASYSYYLDAQNSYLSKLYYAYKSITSMKSAMNAAGGPTEFIGTNHYGTYQEVAMLDKDSGKTIWSLDTNFDPEVPGTDINAMLQIGKIHSELKTNPNLKPAQREEMIDIFLGLKSKT